MKNAQVIDSLVLWFIFKIEKKKKNKTINEYFHNSFIPLYSILIKLQNLLGMFFIHL